MSLNETSPSILPIQWPRGFQIIGPGDRVRVTHLCETRNFPGGPVVYEAGTVSIGTVRNVDPDGFFDLYTDFEEGHGYYVNDATLRVQVLSTGPSPAAPIRSRLE